MDRRRMLAVLGLSPLCLAVPVGAIWPYREASAIAFAAVSAALGTLVGLLQSFSQRGDGGLGAMLQASVEYHRAALALMGEVIQQIGYVELQIEELRQSLPIFLEQQQLHGYYDEVTAGTSQLRNVLDVYATSTGSERKRLDDELLQAQQMIVSARGKLQNHASLDAAIPFAICMASEVTLRYKTGTRKLVAPTLRDYIAWGTRILDREVAGSLVHSIHETALAYDKQIEIAAGSGFSFVEGGGGAALLDCVSLKFKVFPYQMDAKTFVPHDTKGVPGPWNSTTLDKVTYLYQRDRGDGIAREWYAEGVGDILGTGGGCTEVESTKTIARISDRGKTLIDVPSDKEWVARIKALDAWKTLGERQRGKLNNTLEEINGTLLKIALLSRMALTIKAARDRASARLADIGG